jgi:hypothetical protein
MTGSDSASSEAIVILGGQALGYFQWQPLRLVELERTWPGWHDDSCVIHTHFFESACAFD